MKNRRPFLSLVLTLATGALAPLASGQLFVTTLEALEVTADAAVLQMQVEAPAGTDFIAQRFQFGLAPDALLELHQGYDFGLAFITGPEGRDLHEFHEVYDLDAYFTVTEQGDLYDFQRMEYYGIDTPLSITLPGLDAGTSYFFRASAIDLTNGGTAHYGETLSFTTLSVGQTTENLTPVIAVPELSAYPLFLGLGAIAAVVLRRRRR